MDKLKKKCEVWWGLSDSSINLAKELLPTEYITLSPSNEISLFTPSSAARGTASSTAGPHSTAVAPLDNSNPLTEVCMCCFGSFEKVVFLNKLLKYKDALYWKRGLFLEGPLVNEKVNH